MECGLAERPQTRRDPEAADLPAVALPQHSDQHRPEYPVLLAVDQQIGDGAALRVAPELSDPRAQPSRPPESPRRLYRLGDP